MHEAINGPWSPPRWCLVMPIVAAVHAADSDPEAAAERVVTNAQGRDCNQNCHPDDSDLAFGVGRDCNGNGVPDECEGRSCLVADLDCTGAADFGDLLAVLSAWGPCAICDEDLDLSGAVDVADILAVLAAWGMCGSS